MAHKSLEDQLKQLLNNPAAVRSLKTESGRTIGEILKSEVERLKDLIQDEIDLLYSKPQGWYPRTNAFRKALDDNIFIDLQKNTITIGFNDLAIHDSWITKSYNPSYNKKSNVALGINEGFKIFNTGTHFEGTHYLESAIAKFNKNKHTGIKVRLQKTYGGQMYFNEYM